MGTRVAPVRYEGLIRDVHEHYEAMSKTNKLIAEYLTQHPNEMALHSISALAEKCGVHASSLVRFAQFLGFAGFRDLQALFQQRLVTAAPGFEARAARLRSEVRDRQARGVRGHLREVALRDIASIEDLLESIPEKDLSRAITLLANAQTIYLLGQLRSEPVVNLLRYVLTMIGRRCVLLDAGGGLATQMAKVMGPKDVLFAVSSRFYATEAVNITEQAATRGVPIIAITDTTLSPLAKVAKVMFPIPEPEYTFSRSLAAPMCLAHALTLGLAAKLGDGSEAAARIPVATAE